MQWLAEEVVNVCVGHNNSRHHMAGKCKQYSAAQHHNGWCVCRLYWTVDPIFPEGERGKQKQHRREIKDDSLNQKAEVSHGRRALARHKATVRFSPTARWRRGAIVGSRTIKCIAPLKCGREGVITWRKTLLVIKTISATCWSPFPVEIQVVHTSTRRNS